MDKLQGGNMTCGSAASGWCRVFGSHKQLIMNTKHTFWKENVEQKWRILLLKVLKRIRHKLPVSRLQTNLGLCRRLSVCVCVAQSCPACAGWLAGWLQHLHLWMFFECVDDSQRPPGLRWADSATPFITVKLNRKLTNPLIKRPLQTLLCVGVWLTPAARLHFASYISLAQETRNTNSTALQRTPAIPAAALIAQTA